MTSSPEKNKSARVSLLAKPLGMWVRFVIKCRYFVLFASVAAAVWAGLYALENLKYKNKRLDLINPKSEWNQYWLDYISKFGSTDDVIIAIDGKTPEQILDSVDAVAAELEQHTDMYYSLFYKVDDSAMVSKALHYASQDELQGLLMFLQSNDGVFKGHWENLSIDHLLGQSTQALLAPEGAIPEIVRTKSEETIDRLITSLEGVFASEYKFVSPFPEVDIAKHRSAITTDPNGMRPNSGKGSAALFQGFPQTRPETSQPQDATPQPLTPNSVVSTAITAVPEETVAFLDTVNASNLDTVNASNSEASLNADDFALETLDTVPSQAFNTASVGATSVQTVRTTPANGGYAAYYPDAYSSYAEIQAVQQASAEQPAGGEASSVQAATYVAPIAAPVAKTSANRSTPVTSAGGVVPTGGAVIPVSGTTSTSLGNAVTPNVDPYLNPQPANELLPQTAAGAPTIPQPPRRLSRPRASALPQAPQAAMANVAPQVGRNVQANIHGASAMAAGAFAAVPAQSAGASFQPVEMDRYVASASSQGSTSTSQGNTHGMQSGSTAEDAVSAAAVPSTADSSATNSSATNSSATDSSATDAIDSVVVTAATGRSESMHYFWAVPNKTAVVMLKIKENGKAEFANGTKEVQTLRDILAKVGAAHPDTQLSLTGLPIMEFDEMSSSQDTMNVATWLSVLGVTLLYMFFFRGLRHPVMAVFALFIGIGWSMAFITLYVGHLNILSISFAVILVGLGIDFGIHFTSCYLEKRRQGDDTRTALINGAEQIGPGIFTGALTTAAAFFMAGLTEFTGVAELGQIAGGGILLCCMAAFTVLPIFIYTCDKRRPAEKLPKPANPNVLLAGFQTHSLFTMVLCLVLIAVCVYGMRGLYFDYNLLNLQPEGLESVTLEKRLIEDSKQSVWYALSMSKDREELLKRIEAFNKLDTVERVEQILTLLPEEDAQRTGMISQIHQILAGTPQIAGAAPVLSLQEMETCFMTITSYLKSKSQYSAYSDRLARLRKNFHAMTSPVYFQRMQEYQKSLGEDLLSKMQALQKVSTPEAPALSDLPQPLVDRFMAPDGTYLLKVYGKGDLWDMDNLRQFVDEVRTVDAKATGNPLQTYECSLQMKKCYEEAAWYALFVVLVLLYIDLRSVRHTLFAISPVLFGLICTFGIMGFFGIPLNSANMIVLPLILGIGIDDGVHIVHDFRHQHGNGKYRLTPSVSMSVILTSLTTIMGFGTLMIAQHRGLQSLGLVLSLGVGCCCLTSLLLLPAMLSVFCCFAEEGRKPELENQTNHENTQEQTADGTNPTSGSVQLGIVHLSDPAHSQTTATQSTLQPTSTQTTRTQTPGASTSGTPKLQINRYTSTATGEIQQSTVRAA